MFTAPEKDMIIGALEDKIGIATRAQRAARFPEMSPVYDKHISLLRALIEKVRNAKN